jgi:lysozyme
VNQRDWPAAAEEMRRWVWGGGKKLPGLILRREEAAKLLLMG